MERTEYAGEEVTLRIPVRDRDGRVVGTLFIPPEWLDGLRRALGIPNVQWTVFDSYYKGWHSVSFGRAYPEPPAVAAVCSGFYYPFPKIPKLPDLTLPRLYRPDYRPAWAETLRDAFKDVAGDWGVLNWLRDKFASIFYYIGWALGYLQNTVFDKTLKPQFDDVNEKLEDFEDTWNEEIVDRFNSAISEVQEKMLNLMKNLGVTPLAVRNVTRTGCEVFAPTGVTVYLITAGKF